MTLCEPLPVPNRFFASRARWRAGAPASGAWSPAESQAPSGHGSRPPPQEGTRRGKRNPRKQRSPNGSGSRRVLSTSRDKAMRTDLARLTFEPRKPHSKVLHSQLPSISVSSNRWWPVAAANGPTCASAQSIGLVHRLKRQRYSTQPNLKSSHVI